MSAHVISFIKNKYIYNTIYVVDMYLANDKGNSDNKNSLAIEYYTDDNKNTVLGLMFIVDSKIKETMSLLESALISKFNYYKKNSQYLHLNFIEDNERPQEIVVTDKNNENFKIEFTYKEKIPFDTEKVAESVITPSVEKIKEEKVEVKMEPKVIKPTSNNVSNQESSLKELLDSDNSFDKEMSLMYIKQIEKRIQTTYSYVEEHGSLSEEDKRALCDHIGNLLKNV